MEQIDREEREDAAKEEIVLGKKQGPPQSLHKHLENFSSSDDELESSTRPKIIKKKDDPLEPPLDEDFESQVLGFVKRKAERSARRDSLKKKLREQKKSTKNCYTDHLD